MYIFCLRLILCFNVCSALLIMYNRYRYVIGCMAILCFNSIDILLINCMLVCFKPLGFAMFSCRCVVVHRKKLIINLKSKKGLDRKSVAVFPSSFGGRLLSLLSLVFPHKFVAINYKGTHIACAPPPRQLRQRCYEPLLFIHFFI